MASFDLERLDAVGNTRIVNGTNGDDYVYGSKSRDSSVAASLGAGNDYIWIRGGLENFVNGNQGSDQLSISNLNQAAISGRYLGGSDNDRIYVSGNLKETVVNGNGGNDVITGGVTNNLSAIVRGGQGDDIIGVSNALVYGDAGADSFVKSQTAGSTVLDFNPLEDRVLYNPNHGALDVRAVEGGLAIYQGFVGPNGGGTLEGEPMFLKDIFSTDGVVFEPSNLVF